MNSKKIKWILYIIVLVIASTIIIQVYWNYKNYLTNKQQLINDVQISLDNAVDGYFENLALNQTHHFFVENTKNIKLPRENRTIETIIANFNNGISFSKTDSLTINQNINIFKTTPKDSTSAGFRLKPPNLNLRRGPERWNMIKDTIDNPFNLLTSKIVISIISDSLNLKKIDSLFKIELQRKQLNLSYGITYKESYLARQVFNLAAIDSSALTTLSRSTFLPKHSALKTYFNNDTKLILKRIMNGILISTLLVLAVISCLIYMLKIIKHQKELAEVKNDLISNITHEFKTPIATISVALESIQNFNVINDKAKTKSYLDLSADQLSKLTIMVEKLLETATLDSDNLNLNKDTIDLVQLLNVQVAQYKMQSKNKTFSFNASVESSRSQVDIFHFENAINNVIDNAVKYGGDTISVYLLEKDEHIIISISDNGNTLTKTHINQIFEKFYRVPKGNTHDIKGFGIGLYYTKKIIEKHNGTITVALKDNTTFKISIPKL